MEKKARVNQVWAGLVLVYMVSSILVVLGSRIPGGLFVLSLISWIFSCAFLWPDPEQKKIRLGASVLGGILIIFLFWNKGNWFQTTIGVSLVRFTYAAWVCNQSSLSLKNCCHISRPADGPGMILLLPAGFMLFVFSNYLNGLSVFVVNNHLTDTVAEAANGLFTGFIALALAPAILEEILFRGILFRGIGGKWKAIFISALCFGLLHMNFNQMIYAFAVGLLMGWTVWITGNLLDTIILHLIFNSTTVFLNYFQDNSLVNKLLGLKIGAYNPFLGQLANDAGHVLWDSVLWGLFTALIALALFILLIGIYGKLNGKKREKDPDPMEESSWKPDGYFMSGAGFCLLCAVLYEMIR